MSHPYSSTRPPSGRQAVIPPREESKLPLAEELDASTQNIFVQLLMESERRFALRMETQIAAQQSAELTLAEESVKKLSKKARTRGAIAIGSGTTGGVALLLALALYRAVSGIYDEAVAAVKAHGTSNDVNSHPELRTEIELNSARIAKLEEVQIKLQVGQDSLVTSIADMLVVTQSIADKVQAVTPPPKKKRP